MKFLAVCGVILIGALITGVIDGVTGMNDATKDVSMVVGVIHKVSLMLYGIAVWTIATGELE